MIATPNHARTATVLVVDDDEDTRIIVAAALRNAGFRVRAVGDGETALVRAREDPPDLILMDELMPGMLGSETARALKAAKSTASIHILAITALAPAHTRQLLLDAGCEDVLVKPIMPQILVDAVRREIGNP